MVLQIGYMETNLLMAYWHNDYANISYVKTICIIGSRQYTCSNVLFLITVMRP